MNEKEKFVDPADRREYTRLPNHCEVEFSIIRLQGDLLGMGIEKGHTENVSKGGLLLETDALDVHIFNYLNENNVYLDLRIQAPWIPHKIKAVGEVAWFHERETGKFEIGIHFKSIADDNLRFLLKDAEGSGVVIRALQASALIAFVGFLVWAVYHLIV